MALRDKVLRRTFAILELPLAVVDTTLDHKIGAVGTARDFLAAQVRRLDRKMGVGPEAEPVSHFEAESPVTPEAPAAEAKAPAAEAKAPVAEAEAPEAPVAEAPKAEAPEAEEAKVEAPVIEEEAPTESEAEAPKAPFAEYDKLNVHKVSRHVRSADLELLAAVEAYETANKNRKTILNAVEARRERLANE